MTVTTATRHAITCPECYEKITDCTDLDCEFEDEDHDDDQTGRCDDCANPEEEDDEG